jgi:hypothetical protein
MQYKQEPRDDVYFTTIFHEWHVANEDERSSVLMIIKGQFPKHDIEIIDGYTGYRVTETIKNNEEKQEKEIKKRMKPAIEVDKQGNTWEREPQENKKFKKR